MQPKSFLSVVAGVLGLVVAVHELLYYVSHPHASGPALSLAGLGAAICLISFSPANINRPSLAFAGWVRLGVVLTALWFGVVLVYSSYEFFSTSGLDFYRPSQKLLFYQWQMSEDYKHVVLEPSISMFAVALIVPIAALWAVILGAVPVTRWIGKGFEA